MTVTSSYLKAHMERVHRICVPKMRGVNVIGGGKKTYMVSFPRVLQEMKCPVSGFLEEAHSAGRT